jgi:hypothetical protein
VDETQLVRRFPDLSLDGALIEMMQSCPAVRSPLVQNDS